METFTMGTPWHKQRGQAPSWTCDCCACQGFLLCLFFLLTTLDCQEMNKTTRATGMEVVALRLKERTPQESKAVLLWQKYQSLFSWDSSYIWCSAAHEILLEGFFSTSFKRFFQLFHYQGQYPSHNHPHSTTITPCALQRESRRAEA